MPNRTKLLGGKLLGAGFVGYMLHFPGRLIENAVMGWIQEWLEGKNQYLLPLTEQILTIFIEWVAPMAGAFGMIWLAFFVGARYGTPWQGIRETNDARIEEQPKKINKQDASIGNNEAPAPVLYLQVWNDEVDVKPAGHQGFARFYAGNRRTMSAYLHFRPMPEMLIERVVADVGGDALLSDWDSLKIWETYTQYVYFDVPDNLEPGLHEVSVRAYGEGRWWPIRNKLTLNFPSVQEIDLS